MEKVLSADLLLYKLIPYLNGNQKEIAIEKIEKWSRRFVLWVTEHEGKRWNDLDGFVLIPRELIAKYNAQVYLQDKPGYVDCGDIYAYLLYFSDETISYDAFTSLVNPDIREYTEFNMLRDFVVNKRKTIQEKKETERAKKELEDTMKYNSSLFSL